MISSVGASDTTARASGPKTSSAKGSVAWITSGEVLAAIVLVLSEDSTVSLLVVESAEITAGSTVSRLVCFRALRRRDFSAGAGVSSVVVSTVAASAESVSSSFIGRGKMRRRGLSCWSSPRWRTRVAEKAAEVRRIGSLVLTTIGSSTKSHTTTSRIIRSELDTVSSPTPHVS